MATIAVLGSDTVTGTGRSDTYVVDPNDLGSARINDTGGKADVLLVYDRPGRTAGEFLVAGNDLIWRNFEGAEVRVALNPDGTSPIEFFRWERLPEDGNPYTVTLKVVLPGTPITGANVAAVGTAGADVLSAPNFANFQDGWTDIYGNLGNDTLSGSNNHACYLYGGRGNDLLLGKGDFDDYFFGDAGNDRIEGKAGDDYLYGDAGRDVLVGGTGDDVLSGGLGADVFLYNPKGTGMDIIVDYGAGDVLGFVGIRQARVQAVQVGDDVLVSVGIWAQITVQDTQLENLAFDFS